MGKIYGSHRARELAQQEKPAVEYPPLPVPLLRIIYEGEGISISKRANTYVVLLGNRFIQADELNLNKWLLHEWGEKLDSTQFEIASTLLAERIKAEITHHQRQERQKAREEQRALRSTWSAGTNLSEFWGR